MVATVSRTSPKRGPNGSLQATASAPNPTSTVTVLVAFIVPPQSFASLRAWDLQLASAPRRLTAAEPV